MTKTGNEIVERARSGKHWVYWYGGKVELATRILADRLRRENPKVWTSLYYRKATRDILDGRTVCDCSGLVCYSYGISQIGSSSIREKFSEYHGDPLPGMIAWRPGHVGIIIDNAGHMAEMRGIDYDYMETRTWKEAGMKKILYSPEVIYDSYGDDNAKKGWHRDGSGWWYRHTDGRGPETYYHDSFKVIGTHCYYFDKDGYICEVNPEIIKRVNPTSETGWIDR